MLLEIEVMGSNGDSVKNTDKMKGIEDKGRAIVHIVNRLRSIKVDGHDRGANGDDDTGRT